MRILILLLLVTAVFFANTGVAQAPSVYKPIGSMSALMIDIIYPTSNSIFYIEREPPKTEVQWNAIRGQALTLAESGNLLMMPSRARDQGDWMKDAKLLVDVGAKAYEAADAKDLQAIVALNDELNTACIECHQNYRSNYRRRTPAKKE